MHRSIAVNDSGLFVLFLSIQVDGEKVRQVTGKSRKSNIGIPNSLRDTDVLFCIGN